MFGENFLSIQILIYIKYCVKVQVPLLPYMVACQPGRSTEEGKKSWGCWVGVYHTSTCSRQVDCRGVQSFQVQSLILSAECLVIKVIW